MHIDVCVHTRKSCFASDILNELFALCRVLLCRILKTSTINVVFTISIPITKTSVVAK